jgi:20S proteasome alpha/beta subunit
MTLIIGFKCKEGLALVSDTKTTDLDAGEALYESKILTPLENTPFIVGTAGYTNLCNEFTRKIPKIVTKRIAQIRILNIQELIKTGLSREKAIEYIHTKEKCVATNLKSVQEVKNNECKNFEFDEHPIEIPHEYSEEDLIDDCESLVKKINSQLEDVEEPLELLVGMRTSTGNIHLHFIPLDGVEDEINDYFAIGSGSPFVKTFFSRIYDFNKGMNELITQAIRTILYVTIVTKERTVGYSPDNPPEAVIILNDGKYGKATFENESEVISDLEKEMKIFVEQVKQNPSKILKPKIDSKVIL